MVEELVESMKELNKRVVELQLLKKINELEKIIEDKNKIIEKQQKEIKDHLTTIMFNGNNDEQNDKLVNSLCDSILYLKKTYIKDDDAKN